MNSLSQRLAAARAGKAEQAHIRAAKAAPARRRSRDEATASHYLALTLANKTLLNPAQVQTIMLPFRAALECFTHGCAEQEHFIQLHECNAALFELGRLYNGKDEWHEMVLQIHTATMKMAEVGSAIANRFVKTGKYGISASERETYIIVLELLNQAAEYFPQGVILESLMLAEKAVTKALVDVELRRRKTAAAIFE